MAITIGSNYIAASSDLNMQPGGTTTAYYNTQAIRSGNSRTPAFNAAGTNGWRYRDQMGGNGAEWTGGRIGGWAVQQQGAGSYGFNASQGRYYAPITGRYYFYAQTYMRCDNNATNCYIHFMFGVNGNRAYNNGRNPYNIYSHGTQNNYPDGINTSVSINLSAGQYISLIPPWASNNSRIYGAHTIFCGGLIG